MRVDNQPGRKRCADELTEDCEGVLAAYVAITSDDCGIAHCVGWDVAIEVFDDMSGVDSGACESEHQGYQDYPYGDE